MALPNRTFDLNNPKDVDIIQQYLLTANDSEEEKTDSEEENETDNEYEDEERTDNSETEQDDTSSEAEDDGDGEEGYFTAYKRNNQKVVESWKWKKTPFGSKRKKAPHNILVKLPGVVGNAKGLTNVRETWMCLIDDAMIRDIVVFTNQYITSVKDKFIRQRDARTTVEVEIRGFLGLLYLLGVYRANRLNLDELWSSDGDGIEKFRLTMSQRRFRFLMRCLRFDDRDSRPERRATDRLAPIREIFEKFIVNCQNNYSLGCNTTIDEMLVGFRGRCGFRQYIPSKPRKYGIKVFSLVDAKLFYTYNMEIYAGKQQQDLSNKPVDVVKRLATPIYGSGRNITMDNWFTDFNLLKDLGEQKLSLVGTLKKNKIQIPSDFTTIRDRPVSSTLFGFRKEGMVLSYIPKKGKNVILLSSLHDDDGIDPESGEAKKSSVITFYNSTKAGVDAVDQMSETYNVARNTKRWTMAVFFSMLNVAGINSRILYIGNGNTVLSRRQFLRTLANELTHDLIVRRSDSFRGIPLSIQDKIKRYKDARQESSQGATAAANGGGTPAAEATTSAYGETQRKRKRCAECQSQKKNRLTQYRCDLCDKALCLQHMRGLCENCKSAILS